MATVAMGAASFVANVVGLTITPAMQAIIAFIILALGTLANLLGRGVLKILLVGSIIAEIVGSVGLGIWLLLFHVEQPISSITTGLDTVVGSGFTNSSFLIAMAFVGWAFVGFESAGSIAAGALADRAAQPARVALAPQAAPRGSAQFVRATQTYRARSDTAWLCSYHTHWRPHSCWYR
jgi:amino acid transporter